MQMDFHYYATYCAAFLAGFSHGDSLKIAYSAQFVDCCSATLLKKLHAPAAAATTQLQLEMMDYRTDVLGLQEITRIWASFHFLPGDLYADPGHGGRMYKNKYRLICDPNGALLEDTVRLAKDRSLQAAGIAMHVLADTWAHRYFAGTPSLVINNTEDNFTELVPENGEETEKPIRFRHDPKNPDDPEQRRYTVSLLQRSEQSIMNLGHGRAGHLPDYSFLKYKYLPAWGGYGAVIKDNPAEYRMAFCQMIRALEYLKGDTETFERDTYDFDAIRPYEETIRQILNKRQLIACEDWRIFGEQLSGQSIPVFGLTDYQQEYLDAEGEAKDGTFLGQFFLAAMLQKSMVTGKIFASGNLLAGFSAKPGQELNAIRDYLKLEYFRKGGDPK